MKILFVGNIYGASRTQLLIQRLIEFNSDKSYIISFCGTDFYFKQRSNNKILTKVYKFFFLVELFIKIGFSDIIYLMAMNHDLIKPILFCNRFWEKKIVTDLYISAFDTGIDRGYFLNDSSKNGKLKKRLISYDRLILERSTIIIHLTKGELDYIAELVKANIDYSKIKIVPLGVQEKMEAKPTPSKVYRVAWWGTWIPLHGIENILNAIKYISGKEADIKLYMYGVENADKEYYIKYISDLGITDKVIVYTNKSFANGELEKELTNNCDLALGNFGNSKKAENVIVNKIIDAMAMKLPVLTMRNKVLHEFIDIENDLFVCSNSPKDIAIAILNIMNNPEESKRRASNGYNCYKKHFTPKLYTDQILSIIESM